MKVIVKNIKKVNLYGKKCNFGRDIIYWISV